MRAIAYIFILFLAFGCSNYQQVVKKGTPEEKLEAAKKYYNDKDYIRAQPLLEELLGLYYGKAIKEEIYFYLCYSHYGLGEFLLAGYHFNNFAQTYQLSPKREEASYMGAVCNYHKSMPKELDQTPTKNAINSLQAFINKFPNSEFVSDCNTKIDELRERLLEKEYTNAKLYYDLGQYKSAIVACNNALDDYPDMINRDELTYLIVDANYQYAKNSIAKKQKERYNETLVAVNNYTKEFSKGVYIKEVTKIKEKTELELNMAQ